MANIPAQGLVSWGTQIEDVSDRGNEYIVRSYHYVVNRVLKYAKPVEAGRKTVVVPAETNTQIRDLPLCLLNTHNVTHLFDCILGSMVG